ncbi:hypothetical protein BG000_007682 [Podila horticola]|nr:hypothetical protein BG000_007682 [Podila horticola]
MVKSIIAFVAAVAMASSVSAQTLFYSQPIAATQWTAGKTATVSWTNSCTDVVGNTTFPITLNEQAGLYQVEGNTYSILVNNGGNQSYSAHFTILSTIPGNTTTTTVLPTTTAVTTTVATTPLTTVTTTTTGTAKPTPSSHAGALKAGSTAALVVLAAVASMML